MKTFINILAVVILEISLLSVPKLMAQSDNKKHFSYTDNHGDTIIVENIKNLPKKLNTTFFQQNITSEYFLSESDLNNNMRLPYRIFITKIKTKNINKFEMRVLVCVNSKSPPLEILSHGYSGYKLTIKKVNEKWCVDSIIHLYIEI
jgi:hypothetical protein